MTAALRLNVSGGAYWRTTISLSTVFKTAWDFIGSHNSLRRIIPSQIIEAGNSIGGLVAITQTVAGK